MRTLDRSRKFASVHGEHAAGFEQDGCLYSHGGEIMEDLLDDEGRKRLKAFDAKHRRPSDDGGGEATEAPPPPPSGQKPSAKGEVNLTAWLENGERYMLPQIKKAIRDRMNKQFMPNAGKQEIIDFLIDEGTCNPDKLHPMHQPKDGSA